MSTETVVAEMLPRMEPAVPAGKPAKRTGVAVRPPNEVVQYRATLMEDYYKGAASLVERLKAEGKTDSEALLVALVDEVIRESDHLLGNELVATNEGNLRDASVISTKRAEVLERAIKAVQAKKEFESKSGIDVDSPAMVVIIRFFLGKCGEAFDTMGTGPEVKDLFMRTIGTVMTNWKKELGDNFEALRR